ncbi:uncharacterized protein B0J16DRAFT_336573 [Fusarium flagelliforme]|uniref:uncharacterized protein n=1 Tax=Fusarium flagelliforme TaxID=2675880 RepID=UPI001E8EB8E7|nr:uncharacterized protein B0J16DRAFT_336573 [Fusarium flagelliforme]KAH7188185.1 hypothetical protein B0J16DRAFT_336573 [Fusarium flagelliforme]
MAHQAERLPWQSLASVFELKTANSCQHGARNLHPQDTPESRQNLSHFLDAFFKNATIDANQERKKYPDKFDPINVGTFFKDIAGEEDDTPTQYYPPAKDEVILTEESVEKITPTVKHWYPKEEDGSSKVEQGLLCTHTNDCDCALPLKERQLAAFQREYYPNDCWEFYHYNGKAYRNLEFVKTLILNGEMDPVLRVCSSDECHLARWWEAGPCYCEGSDLGWDMLCEYAMTMYLVLNILYCFPDLREGGYRDLGSYQSAIRTCTISSGCQIATYPHRDLFGIEDKQFNAHPRPFDVSRWKHVMKVDTLGMPESIRKAFEETGEVSNIPDCFYKLDFYPYGLMSYDDFLSFEKPVSYQPHESDILEAQQVLHNKGLPAELSDSILSSADHTPKRTLPIARKPFHPDNKAELDGYLEECWGLVVRCVMLGLELESEDWSIEKRVRDVFKRCLGSVFTCECEGRVEMFYNFDKEV